MDNNCTVGLTRETKTDQGIEREGGIANPRCPVIPNQVSVIEKQRQANYAAETHQFLVPPINSGRLNVGLATTAPNKKVDGLPSRPE